MVSSIGGIMKRIGKVQISLELLSEILSGRSIGRPGFRIETTAPEDLKVISIFPGNEHNTAWMYCQSESFDLVPDNENHPELDPFEYSFHYERNGPETQPDPTK